ncbi:MAG TPA: hypothetical protein PL029_05495 [Bacteroidia bacterium]|nr:hypothetical protein [Bacteroidia bacterium]
MRTFVPVKKLIATLTLIGFLSLTTEAHELFKLHHLVAHYYEHSSKQQNQSFAEFLHMHYSADHNNHHDEHQDNGCLPFQGDHGCQINAIGLFSAEEPVDVALKQQVIAIKQQPLLSNFIISDFLSKIWQPPKTA